MKIKRILSAALMLLLGGITHGFCEDQTGKPPRWESSVAAGFTLTRGNSETILTTLTAATGKKWGENELSLGLDGAYGENKDQGTGQTTRSAESLRSFTQYNRLFTERWYGYGRIEGSHDGVADLRYRVAVGPGIGYYFIKKKKIDLSAEGGPGYVWEDLGGEAQDYATLRVAEKFHLQLSDRARVWESAEWLPQMTRPKNYVVNAEIGIEADLTADKKLSLRSFLQDTFNNQPASDRKKNDLKLVTAIAYKF